MKNVEEFKAIILDLYGQCLTCDKRRLEDRDVKKRHLRCKKCQREYERVWFSSREAFYKIFDGQT